MLLCPRVALLCSHYTDYTGYYTYEYINLELRGIFAMNDAKIEPQ